MNKYKKGKGAVEMEGKIGEAIKKDNFNKRIKSLGHDLISYVVYDE